MKPRFGAIVQLLLQPMLCVGAATHLGSGCSPVRLPLAVAFPVARGGHYLSSVVRRRPPPARRPMPNPGALVTVITIPPSKANTPTTAMVDRLT